MATYSEIAHRKVFGIPVLYLAGGFAVILAIVAWKMKSVPSASDTEKANTPHDNGGADASSSMVGDLADYSGLATNGTVIVAPQPQQPADDGSAVVKTNDTWVRDGATWLNKQKGVPGSQALAALTHYVNGVDRSYQEQQWVDMVIAEKGLPPDNIAEGGKVGSKPAKKQFPQPPGTHTITGDSDTTFAALSMLYYGHANPNDIDLIQAQNPTFGKLLGPFAIGTKVKIPAYHDPVYVNSGKKVVSWTAFAAKNGTSATALHLLNDNQKWARGVSIPANVSVRVK